MRMQKGLCIELNKEHSVFIGPNGEFVHGTPVRETAVGEEVYFFPKQAVASKKRIAIKPVWVPVAAALAVALLFLSVLLPKQEAFAYVQVQVNPGIELGFDEDYEVVSIRELNDDGLQLIKELGEWEHHSLDDVLSEVIELSMSDSTDEIVITTVADEQDEIADEAVVNTITAISAKVMAGNVAVRLKEATKKQWRTSVEKSVPVGQLISNSKSPGKNKADEPNGKETDKRPDNVHEKPAKNDKQLKSDLKEKVKEQKETPPGQEKHEETSADEKGNAKPPGQEKRNDVQGKTNNKDVSEPDKPSKEKGKETAPGQQKQKGEHAESKKATDSKEKDTVNEEDRNKEKDGEEDKEKDKDNSAPKAKAEEKKPKPAVAEPQNYKGNNAVKENDSPNHSNSNGKNKGN